MTIQEHFLQVLNPSVLSRLGHIRHALFDFDGTLSTLRQGWEATMLPVMLEAISPGQPCPPAIVDEVQDYIDRSTGILTIHQMEWLAEAVRRYGLTECVLSPAEYKALYLKRLMVYVQERIARVANGQEAPADRMVVGSQAFVQRLAQRGVQLYLASGTDHPDVVREATVLGMAPFFSGGIYGALDVTEVNDKGRLIARILDDHGLAGEQLLVVGDGPVEIREAQRHGALTLGVASDELLRSGWNQRKVTRLSQAGCDFLAADFSQSEDLLAFLFPTAQGK